MISIEESEVEHVRHRQHVDRMAMQVAQQSTIVIYGWIQYTLHKQNEFNHFQIDKRAAEFWREITEFKRQFAHWIARNVEFTQRLLQTDQLRR